MSEKHIFDYMDYREYLRDFFAEKKRELAFYSYRMFSQKAGFKSPNFLKLVIEGDRNISKESTFRFSKALGHSKKEADYFENLVFFNQSKTLEEKNAYLGRVMRYRVKCDPRKIEESEFSYYSHWYNPIVRELVTAIDFRGDFRSLGASVVPAISAADAEKSVALLTNIGFIKQRPDGSYEKSAASLTTGPQVRSVAVANYHRAMMRLASESIERFAAAERDITSVTVCVSNETYQSMIQKLQQLRREFLEMAEGDCETQRVVQLNLQLFPVSTALGDGSEQS